MDRDSLNGLAAIVAAVGIMLIFCAAGAWVLVWVVEGWKSW